MTEPVTLEQGLRDILASEGLTKIMVGAFLSRFTAQVHYDIPDEHPADVIGCSFGYGDTVDEAVEAALATMRTQLARCAAYRPDMAEAA